MNISQICLFYRNNDSRRWKVEVCDILWAPKASKGSFFLFYFLQPLCLKFENLDVLASELRMVGLQRQLGPRELLAHQPEELLHRVQLLLTFPLLWDDFTTYQFLEGNLASEPRSWEGGWCWDRPAGWGFQPGGAPTFSRICINNKSLHV